MAYQFQGHIESQVWCSHHKFAPLLECIEKRTYLCIKWHKGLAIYEVETTLEETCVNNIELDE